MDNVTSAVSKGHFARICVEVDLLKLLVSKFRLRRRIWRLEYEGLHLVCFGCGLFGYRKETCPLVEQLTTAGSETSKRESSGWDPERNNVVAAEARKESIIPEIVECFGPCMLAKR